MNATATSVGARHAGPYVYATTYCRDLSRSTVAYQALLGYRSLAGHSCPDRRCQLLFPQDRAIGGIHLVERPDAGRARPWQVPGGAALEIVIRDAEQVAAHAETVAGFEVIGGPRPAGANRRLRVVHVRGPDDEVLYLARILPADRPHVLPMRPRQLVGRVYSVVIAVPDLDSARTRLRSFLAGNPISDRAAALATAALVRGDPASSSSYRISSMSIAGGAIIELDQMPGIEPVGGVELAGPVSARLLGPGGPFRLPLDLSDPETTLMEEIDP